jgi:hypothetical protein
MSTTVYYDRPAQGGTMPDEARPGREKDKTMRVDRPAPAGWRTKAYRAGLLALALMLLATVAYGWLRLRRVEDEAAAQVQQARAEAQAAVAKAGAEQQARGAALDRAFDEQAGRLLRLSAVPLAWAVRDKLMQQDYAAIGAYFQELVREPGVRRAVLVLPDGNIKLASDQKLEAVAVSQVFPGLSLEGDAPRVEGVQGEIVVVVPVMGLTTRLGTVVVGYEARVGAPPR